MLIPLTAYKQYNKYLYLMAHGTWHNGGRNVLTGTDPEKVSNIQKTNPENSKGDQEGRAEKVC